MKKSIFRLLLAGLLAIVTSQLAFAQHEVTVTVKDAMGPIPGANVMVQGTTVGEITNIDGIAKLSNIKDEDVLVISFIGYQTVEVTAGSKAKLTVTMEQGEELEETVVVGYGVQKKSSLTSSIANINSEDIVSTKQASLVNSLQGKVPGLQIRQNSGQPGFFDSDLSLRGYGEPLVIIDGVARTGRRMSNWGLGAASNSSGAALAELNPEDIESITVLKDASASIYGMGSQNGVILVTTKKGQAVKPSVTYSNTLAFGVPTAMPEQVDIVTFMEVQNEKMLNSKKPAIYSDEFIQHYKNGDPGYINTNYYDQIMKKFTFNQVHNISLRGGNQQTQYYLSANYTNDKSLYRTDNAYYNRYGFTGNVTTKITPELTVTYQTAINVNDRSNVYSNTMLNIFYYALLSDPTIPATVYGNPEHYTDPNPEHRNPLGLLDPETSGYAKTYGVSVRNNLDVKYEAPFLKGLVFQASGAYDFSNNQDNELIKNFQLYDYFTDKPTAPDPSENSYSESWSKSSRYYGKVQANYNTTVKGVHHIGATLAAETTIMKNASLNGKRLYGNFVTHDTINQADGTTATNGGSRSSTASAGYISRLTYDYKGKYLAEVMARYDGSYVYAPGHRWGLFPSYSLGWRVSDEKIVKDNLPWLNNFKLRWSDGHMSQQQGSPYAYLLGYTTSGSYSFDEGQVYNGYVSHAAAETLLSWANVRMMDFGFDWEVKRGLIGGSIDWFWRNTSGIQAQSSNTVPGFYGLSLPYENLNKSQNVGIDLTLSHHNEIGKFSYRVAATATFSRSRTTYQESDKTALYASSLAYWQNHSTGRWGNAHSAQTYHWAAGNPQYGSWAQIGEASTIYDLIQSNNALVPGMYHIEDRNGDGVINDSDQYYDWAESNPPLQFGLTFSGRYKNFDFNLNFNGASLTNKTVSLNGGMGFMFFNTFSTNYLDRYHLADGYKDPFDPQAQWVSGYWPALVYGSTAYDTPNATYTKNQPYTFVNGTYVRLKSVEIGYTVPGKYANKIGLKSARVYVNGTNLLTFCNKLLKPYDPERNQNQWLGAGGYPLLKTFSFGVNVNF